MENEVFFFNPELQIPFDVQLLADFTVSVNETRVVIITYSSVDRVLRQVDHMTQPSNDYHKCLLIEEQIPAITYNSGGTYTLGAMMQAIEVFQVTKENVKQYSFLLLTKCFQHGRPKSAKCVFLITDGYSNGGDPVPAADTVSSCELLQPHISFKKWCNNFTVKRHGSDHIHFWNPERKCQGAERHRIKSNKRIFIHSGFFPRVRVPSKKSPSWGLVKRYKGSLNHREK